MMKCEKCKLWAADIRESYTCTFAPVGFILCLSWQGLRDWEERKKTNIWKITSIKWNKSWRSSFPIQKYPIQNATYTWWRNFTHYQIGIWLISNLFVKKGYYHRELIAYEAYNVIWITIKILNSHYGKSSEMELEINSAMSAYQFAWKDRSFPVEEEQPNTVSIKGLLNVNIKCLSKAKCNYLPYEWEKNKYKALFPKAKFLLIS